MATLSFESSIKPDGRKVKEHKIYFFIHYYREAGPFAQEMMMVLCERRALPIWGKLHATAACCFDHTSIRQRW
jgi:hypothetical protein